MSVNALIRRVPAESGMTPSAHIGSTAAASVKHSEEQPTRHNSSRDHVSSYFIDIFRHSLETD